MPATGLQPTDLERDWVRWLDQLVSDLNAFPDAGYAAPGRTWTVVMDYGGSYAQLGETDSADGAVSVSLPADLENCAPSGWVHVLIYREEPARLDSFGHFPRADRGAILRAVRNAVAFLTS